MCVCVCECLMTYLAASYSAMLRTPPSHIDFMALPAIIAQEQMSYVCLCLNTACLCLRVNCIRMLHNIACINARDDGKEIRVYERMRVCCVLMYVCLRADVALSCICLSCLMAVWSFSLSALGRSDACMRDFSECVCFPKVYDRI